MARCSCAIVTLVSADDPKFDDASSGVVVALTFFYSGEPANADAELEKLKATVPEEAVDFMFGAMVMILAQLADHMKRDSLELVREMGLNLANLKGGE